MDLVDLFKHNARVFLGTGYVPLEYEPKIGSKWYGKKKGIPVLCPKCNTAFEIYKTMISGESFECVFCYSDIRV